MFFCFFFSLIKIIRYYDIVLFSFMFSIIKHISYHVMIHSRVFAAPSLYMLPSSRKYGHVIYMYIFFPKF